MTLKSKIKDFENLIPCYLPYLPNSDQVDAIQKISEFILNTEKRSLFILKGYAGTGKTNLISAITKALPSIKWRSVLLAPTGRAAKVLSNYSQRQAQTIHKKIFNKEIDLYGDIFFTLGENLHRTTLFIVDEASMISADLAGGNFFKTVLENLFEYIYSGENCKLILIGDTAQLPPVGSDESLALNEEYLKAAFHLEVKFIELKEVARQKLESGILLNATNLRNSLTDYPFIFPKLNCGIDVIRLNGEALEDVLNEERNRYGEDNLIIITKSNKRANLFNQSYRNRIKLAEEDLCTGDKIMIIKNNYFWLTDINAEMGFIANGEMAEITSIINRENKYGFNFCECHLKFCDYLNLPPLQVKIITDCLFSDTASLSKEQQKELYENVMNDLKDEPIKGLRKAYLKKNPYFNALQVKFSYAITCHKSQGGQWPVVFIDQGFLKEEQLDKNYVRWLYTSITRATEKIYLINFNDELINN